MAKGNMLLGYSRGSVGDLVFKREKGKQVTAPRNRNPKNPKTKAQMSSRIRFASVTEFYHRGVQNLFQFAFEEKNIKHSDFNIFQSLNADLGIYLKPEQLKDPKFPIVSPFIVSRGSLTRPIEYGGGYYKLGKVSGFSGEQPTTVAALSTFLVSKGFEVGDIVTILNISTGNLAHDVKPYGAAEDVRWHIGQFKVDLQDTNTLASKNVFAEPVVPDSSLSLRVADTINEDMGCVIVSRNEPNGLKVTSTSIALGDNAVYAYYAAKDDVWKDECIDIWGASEEAILQGSLS